MPYCVQCKQFIAENTDHLLWFENHFCSSLCLKKYHSEQMDRSCTECKSSIPTLAPAAKNVIMLRSLLGNLVFCNLKCVRQYRKEHVLCAYCSIEVTANNQLLNDVNCEQMVKFCSLECEMRMDIHVDWQMKSMKLAKCSICNELTDIEMGLFMDGIQYVACSEGCFIKIGQHNGVKNEVCCQCMRPFDGENNGSFVISEMAACNVFCSDACMVFFMLNSTKKMDCVGCGTTASYFHMVRSGTLPTQVFCSIECLDVKRYELNENKPEVMNQFGMDCDANNNTDTLPTETVKLSQCKVEPLSKDETKELLKHHESDSVRCCTACNSRISNEKSFFRWHLMDLCSAACLNEMLKCNSAEHRCWECQANINISNAFVHIEYIEAEPRNFCSKECLAACLGAISMCNYCQITISDDGIEEARHATNFCSSHCEENFKRIIVGAAASTLCEEKYCTQCNQRRPITMNLFFKEKTYPICSFTCLSHVQYLFGICTDLCVQCNSYFVENATDNFTVYRDTKAHVLCSKVCRYHFMQKVEMLVSCSFCDEWDYDLYMLQLVDQQSILNYFCSISCYYLSVESSAERSEGGNGDSGNGELEHGDKTDGTKFNRKNADESDAADDENDENEDNEDASGAPKFKNAATQTDKLMTKCTCDSVIVRHATKRLANNSQPTSKPSDQDVIQSKKVAHEM